MQQSRLFVKILGIIQSKAADEGGLWEFWAGMEGRADQKLKIWINWQPIGKHNLLAKIPCTTILVQPWILSKDGVLAVQY